MSDVESLHPQPDPPPPSRDHDHADVAVHALEHGASPPQRHPGGLYVLFFTEMWERFSFYGMKAFLILYMTAAIATGGLELSLEQAGTFFGWYTGLVYLTPILGGYLADRWLGTHWSMIIGGLVISAGHFTLALQPFEAEWSGEKPFISFFAGLALVIIGTGFFKPCVSVMVGQLYRPRDARRDAAFTIFYMGINLGAFLGPLVCGGLRIAKQDEAGVYGWHWAFAAAGVGMLLGLVVYAIGRPFLLRGIGVRPQRPAGGAAAGRTRPPLTREDRHGVAAILIMSFFVIFFWVAFEQAGSSMNLFAEERVDRSLPAETASALYRFSHEPGYGVPWWLLGVAGAALLGCWIALARLARTGGALSFVRIAALAAGATLVVVALLKGTGFLGELFPESLLENPEYPTEWFQSVNPFFILALAPIFASLWLRLGRAGREPSTPVKFGLGLLLLGGGFIFMVLGAMESSAADGTVVRVSGLWLLAAYCVHTMGELCLSPVGLSMVTKVAPLHLVSMLMGVWFLANFVANLAGGIIAGRMEQIAEQGFILDGLAGFFLLFVIAPVIAGVVVLALSPMIGKLMHGRA